MSDKRAVIRIQLDDHAKQNLDAICKRRGMTQIAIMSRLVNWFTTQDDLIQASVLNVISDDALAPLARRLLQRMSTNGKPGSRARTS